MPESTEQAPPDQRKVKKAGWYGALIVTLAVALIPAAVIIGYIFDPRYVAVCITANTATMLIARCIWKITRKTP